MIKRGFIVLFWLAVAFAFIMAILPNPPQPPIATTDKVQHVVAFAVLTILGSAAYPRLSPLALLLGFATYGGLIEVVQAVPSLHRSSESADWVADVAAVVITLAIVWALRRLGLRYG